LQWDENPAATPEELCRPYADRPDHGALLQALREGIADLRAASPFVVPTNDLDAELAATLPPVTKLSHVAPTEQPTAATDPLVGRALGEYEVLGVLGRGGMGVVYRAWHRGLKRVSAIKMVLAGGHADPKDLARFRTEAEAIAQLQHPNIVQIYEIGEAE